MIFCIHIIFASAVPPITPPLLRAGKIQYPSQLVNSNTACFASFKQALLIKRPLNSFTPSQLIIRRFPGHQPSFPIIPHPSVYTSLSDLHNAVPISYEPTHKATHQSHFFRIVLTFSPLISSHLAALRYLSNFTRDIPFGAFSVFSFLISSFFSSPAGPGGFVTTVLRSGSCSSGA